MLAKNKIIIINGEKNSATILYRSKGAERCLKNLGFFVDVLEIDTLDNINLHGVIACLFVRTPLTQTVSAFIHRLQSLFIVVVADFDDLIFRPDLLHFFDGIKYFSNDEHELFFERTFQFQEMVKIADVVVVTSTPLAAEATRYNKQIKVIRNYPLEITKGLSVRSEVLKHNPQKFIIGYYSGTLTHQADFRQCSQALAQLMEKSDHVELRAVGKINIDEFTELKSFGSRITKMPLMNYENMLIDLRRCDLSLAPLEVDNAFCECKSELKYFDAALMCVPTIASPTHPFKAAIKHGFNGYLARTQQDWLDCLEKIVTDKASAKRVGASARRHVLSFFGEMAQLNDYRSLMKMVASQRCRAR